MRMFAVFTVSSLCIVGCSKKSVEQGDAQADTGTNAAAVSSRVNPQISADLTDVSKKVESQDYDNAVKTLATLHQVPKSDADEKEYLRQVYATMDALRERAEKDAKAREALQQLGRAMTGR